MQQIDIRCESDGCTNTLATAHIVTTDDGGLQAVCRECCPHDHGVATDQTARGTVRSLARAFLGGA